MEVSNGYLTASTSTSPDSSSSDTFDSYAGISSTEDSNPSASTRRQSSRLKAKKKCDISADSEKLDGLQSVAGGTGSAPSGPAPGRCRKRTAAGEEKYNLRLSSLVKRVQVERKHATPKEPKGKSKPPPLSKYRRRTANARERMRMRDINEGFERLKSCLPELEEQEQKGKKEKVTKFTILSLALNYIHALRQVLGYEPLDSGVCGAVSGSDSCETKSESSSNSSNSISSISGGECSSKDINNNGSMCSNSNSGGGVYVSSSINSNETCSSSSTNINSNTNVNSSNNSSLSTQVTNVTSPGSTTSDDSELGADAAASTHIISASLSSSCLSSSSSSSSSSSLSLSDDLCSSPSPVPSVLDLKEYYLPYTPLPADLGASDLPLARALRMKDYVLCSDPVTPGMEVRGDALCSPSPSLSSNSLSPPPPPLPLPEDCLMFGDSGLCLDLPMTLSTLQDCIDMGL